MSRFVQLTNSSLIKSKICKIYTGVEKMTDHKIDIIKEAEYVYTIHKPETILFKVRHRYKSLDKPFPELNTGILHTLHKGDVGFIGYKDSDGCSSEEGGKPLKDRFGKEIPCTRFETLSKTEKMVRFGFLNLRTDLKENDIYWIEINAEMKGLVKKENNRYKLPIDFTNEEKDSVVFKIKVPSKPEGILRHQQTRIESVTPAPSVVYDEMDYKVFQWNLGARSKGERDKFDVEYQLEWTYSPLIRYLVGAVIGIILVYALAIIQVILSLIE